MLSLSLQGDYLAIKTEARLSSELYKKYMNFIDSTTGSYFVDKEYTWMVPKVYVDEYAKQFEDITAWKNTIEEIKGIQEVLLPEFPLITDYDDFKLKPFDFQQQGISFLAHAGSGIIGDEMGLGKTLQSLGGAHILWKQGKVKKILVICPASLKYQWSKEINLFLDHKNIVIDGSTKKQKEEAFNKFINEDYLIGIVNYELVRTMKELFQEHHYSVIIASIRWPLSQ